MPPFSADTVPANALAERARILLEMGRPREALPLLAQAAATDPGSARIFCLMALAHLKAGDCKACVQAAEGAIRTAPNSEWGHRLRAHGLMGQRRSRQALQAAQEAVRCAPQETQALHSLVLAQLGMGLVRGADATARTLRALGPETAWAHEAMGLVALRRQRWQDAEEYFRTSLRINPLSHAALNNLGVALRHRGRLPEAIDCFYQASKLMPTNKKAPQNMDEAVCAYLFPLYIVLFVAWVSASVGIWISGLTTGGAADGTALIGATMFTIALFMLEGRRRLRTLSAEIRNVIHRRARNFLRFSTRNSG